MKAMDYPGSVVAEEVLTPNSLVVVTGPIGSGMTDFTFQLLQHFKGAVFTTEYLQSPPANYRQMSRLSQALAAIAVVTQSRLPFAMHIDHAGVTSFTVSRKEITRRQWCIEWLVKAIQKANGTLVLRERPRKPPRHSATASRRMGPRYTLHQEYPKYGLHRRLRG